ncbi:inactive angiotensin-converting enzyme-related protein-like [Colias croceus]|uniref:inactive angiotensin-converting enzyme-related protein-like n=1 Tax=Colias crocea TaxID=72248 RepID=UPI001E27D9CA|nr:inactive angiotensin-converting enzyme-related protein-like [Colias croceus]XP_045496862.1 inactive angiotensin-converting enzyme-related protein-like [Colias croceus]XP_045496863.1 inactive angiotensin-converting enzyme-related protein-like [Colias croceus]
MRPTLQLLSVCFYALLSSGTSSGDDRRWLVSLIDLVEFDYQDQCTQRATATWEELTGNSKGLSLKLERDKAYGIFARQQKTDVKTAFTAHSLTADDDILRRRVKLLLQPGDSLLETEQWIRLVTFADKSLNHLRFAADYDCGANANCTLRELQNSIAREQDEEKIKQMKSSWEKKLPDINYYFENVLPLLRNATKENLYNTVEEYWDSLVEYEGAMLKAREIWDHVKPLYVKLHKYVALRLKGADTVGKPLPVYALKSLTGDDWSNLIESLLPKHSDIYQKVYANLHLMDMGGLNAFKEAEKLIKHLNFGEIPSEILTESDYNGSCPTSIVDWCQPNKMKYVTCKDVSIPNYMEAHEVAMKIKYKLIAATHSNNTYILREAPRYSAIYEAIPGFVSLLSMNPHTLDRAGLYSLDRFNYNPNYHRLVLQLIIALRDLPKLNFYIAADEWRLQLLMGKIPFAKIGDSWSEFRKNFSLIESSNIDVLGDPYVVSNKPYIGKFMGLILKYQVYQSFAEELMSDDGDLVTHVADNNQRLIDAMMQGYGFTWTEMVSDVLAKRENGLEYTGLTDYFRLLDEYLDNQLDPTSENTFEDYIDPPSEEPVENEIPEEKESPVDYEDKYDQETPKTHEDINENIIETDEEPHAKFGLETSTVGVLEIKNPVAASDQNDSDSPKEASYNVYWWIGIAVAILVVVVLVAIIARKRHNHRKQLERQRRQNTRA